MNLKISVCSPSYRRPWGVDTFKAYPQTRFYVDRREAEEYRKMNPGIIIVECPEGVQGNVQRVRNYLIDNEFSLGVDAVCIMDDDVRGLYFWEKNDAVLIDKDELQEVLEKYTMLAYELGAMAWGANVNTDRQGYIETKPLGFKDEVLGPFLVILRGNEIRYDPRMVLKEDYDFFLMNMHRYRKVLRVNKMFYNCKQSEQAGGCAGLRNIEKEREAFERLQKKWGKKIVRLDYGKAAHARKAERMTIDYNPKIVIP
jgi:hypothetical protein